MNYDNSGLLELSQEGFSKTYNEFTPGRRFCIKHDGELIRKFKIKSPNCPIITMGDGVSCSHKLLLEPFDWEFITVNPGAEKCLISVEYTFEILVDVDRQMFKLFDGRFVVSLNSRRLVGGSIISNEEFFEKAKNLVVFRFPKEFLEGNGNLTKGVK